LTYEGTSVGTAPAGRSAHAVPGRTWTGAGWCRRPCCAARPARRERATLVRTALRGHWQGEGEGGPAPGTGTPCIRDEGYPPIALIFLSSRKRDRPGATPLTQSTLVSSGSLVQVRCRWERRGCSVRAATVSGAGRGGQPCMTTFSTRRSRCRPAAHAVPPRSPSHQWGPAWAVSQPSDRRDRYFWTIGSLRTSQLL